MAIDIPLTKSKSDSHVILAFSFIVMSESINISPYKFWVSLLVFLYIANGGMLEIVWKILMTAPYQILSCSKNNEHSL